MAAETKIKHDQKFLESIYKEMMLYRRFEEKVNVAYQKGKFAGFLHLHIGQEALCVGVQRSLRETDYVISGYRSHTQSIAKGIEPKRVMAELFGRKDGICEGKGGSMHMFSKEHRFLGGHGIVGGQCPLAAGVGFAIRYNKTDDVIVCYLGDAATNQGQFFEAMNMAATWELPVLYIVENNQYGMGTDIRRTTSIDRLSKRALAFDMDHSEVDGMDVLKVHGHVSEIVGKMRKKQRPYLLEALTYRYRGHSVSDPQSYRTKEEVAENQKRDPILQIGELIKKNKFATDVELKEWDKAIREEMQSIEDFAEASPKPPIEDAWTHVYAD